MQFAHGVERALRDGSVGARTPSCVRPRDLKEQVEATAGIRLVLHDGIEHWLVMGSIDLPPGLSPPGLGGVPLEDVQPLETLGRLPVGNPRGKARQVVGSGMRVW